MSIFDLFADIPEAVKGLYSNGEFGTEIVLFEGGLKLKRKAEEIKGDGTISLSWTPSPKIRFKLTAENAAKRSNAFENGWEVGWTSNSSRNHFMSDVKHWARN